MSDLKFDLMALVEPKTPADVEAIWEEIVLAMEARCECLDLMDEKTKKGQA